MARDPEYLVKLTQNGETVYLFCSSVKSVPTSRLKSVGQTDLQSVYDSAPKAEGVAILPSYPPPGPTLPNGSKDNTLDWETYASRIQVGP